MKLLTPDLVGLDLIVDSEADAESWCGAFDTFLPAVSATAEHLDRFVAQTFLVAQLIGAEGGQVFDGLCVRKAALRTDLVILLGFQNWV